MCGWLHIGLVWQLDFGSDIKLERIAGNEV